MTDVGTAVALSVSRDKRMHTNLNTISLRERRAAVESDLRAFAAASRPELVRGLGKLGFGTRFASRYQIGNRLPRPTETYEAWDHVRGLPVLVEFCAKDAAPRHGFLDWGVGCGALFRTYTP